MDDARAGIEQRVPGRLDAQADFMAKNFVGKLVVVPDSKWQAMTA